MGFLSKLFAGLALNRLAKTFDECFNALRRYSINRKEDELFLAMWLFTYGVKGSLKKWHWNPLSTRIYIPNHQEMGRVTIYQATMIFNSSIMDLADRCGIADELTDILDQGETFHAKSYLCSVDLKKKLMP